MTRPFLLLLAVGLSSCGGTPVAPGPAVAPPARTSTPSAVDAGAATASTETGFVDPPASPRDTKLVAKTLAQVAILRGIKPRREVPGVKLEREALVARIKDKALREYPPDALKREGLVLQLFGFAPPGFDYLGETLRLLEAQLDGFYEPKNGTMYLAADLHGSEAQATLAHELVHALQDQAYDLKSRSGHKPGRSDESLALASLAEGDATSVMMDFVLKGQNKTALDLPLDTMRAMMEAGMTTGATKNVPHILKSSLVAPYVNGLEFVHGLRKRGGFRLVDRAWERPPQTTEQVLHVDKWESNEPALAVSTPTAKALGDGWKREDEDSFGELGLSLTLGEWIDPDDAREVASGWGGDRASEWSRGQEIAFALHVRYDPSAGARPDAYAERALKKLAPALKALTSGAIVEPTLICVERPQLGPLLVARQGREFVILAGPAKVDPAGWVSTGDCTTAKRWATEVLAAP